MGSILKSLIWKEWREQRWKLGFGCALLVSVTAIGLRARLVEDFGVHGINVSIGGFLLPLFVAMGLVAAERAGGTLGSLLAMPVEPWLVFAVKLAGGAVVTVLPLLAACLTALAIAGEREIPWVDVLRIHLAGAALGLVVLVWSSCLAIGQPTEARVGLVGLGWIGACVLAFPVAELLDLRDENMVWHPIWLVQPQAHPHLNPLRPEVSLWTAVAPWVIQGAMAAALIVWAAWRFGRTRRAR